MLQCSDNRADRAIGAYWETKFCLLAAGYGLMFSPLQIGRKASAIAVSWQGKAWNTLTLPDVTIWTAPGQHHEIKHKAPTPGGCFGLEVYRFDALLAFAAETQQAVFYTIHNHALAGGRDVKISDPAHWLTTNVNDLRGKQRSIYPGKSWIAGKPVDNVPILYWPVALWQPLSAVFGPLQVGRKRELEGEDVS